MATLEHPAHAPQHGIGAILTHAWELYRAHWKTFITAAAIVFVPIYLMHALLMAAFLPGAATTSGLDARAQRIEARSRLLEQHQRSGSLDSAEAQRVLQENLADASANVAQAGAALAGIGLFLLSLVLTIPLTIVGSFFATAAVVPLVDDRVHGGTMTPGAAWSEVGKHVVPLIVTSLLAAVIVTLGFLFFVVPGLILGFLFAFAAPLVMLGNKAGFAALKESTRLVIANLVPTLVVMIVLAVLGMVARFVGGLLIPDRFVFLHTLVQDLVALLVFPIPIIGIVLLYHEAHQDQPSPQLGEPIAAPH